MQSYHFSVFIVNFNTFVIWKLALTLHQNDSWSEINLYHETSRTLTLSFKSIYLANFPAILFLNLDISAETSVIKHIFEKYYPCITDAGHMTNCDEISEN